MFSSLVVAAQTIKEACVANFLVPISPRPGRELVRAAIAGLLLQLDAQNLVIQFLCSGLLNLHHLLLIGGLSGRPFFLQLAQGVGRFWSLMTFFGIFTSSSETCHGS